MYLKHYPAMGCNSNSASILTIQPLWQESESCASESGCVARAAAAVGDSKGCWTCEILKGWCPERQKMLLKWWLHRHDMFQCFPQISLRNSLFFWGENWMRMLKPQRLHRACHSQKRLRERPGHTLKVFFKTGSWNDIQETKHEVLLIFIPYFLVFIMNITYY